MRKCSLVLIVIVATLALITQVSAAKTTALPSVVASESTYEGWLDVVASDGWSRIYLQTPDRSQSFIMAYDGVTFTDTASQIYVSGTVRSTPPSRELVNVTVSDKKTTTAPKPFFMSIKDIWLEFNPSSGLNSTLFPQARRVKIVGRIDKSLPDEIYVIENDKKILLQGWFDATDIANNSLVEATGCLDFTYNTASGLNVPCIVVNPEGACPQTYCYGNLRQLTP